LSTTTVQTKLGTFTIEYTARGISRVGFPPAKRREEQNATEHPAFVRKFCAELRRYATGERRACRAPVDLSSGTRFQRHVWRAMARIPHGQTRSYAWIAQKLRKPGSTRAVGAACGANPVPLIVPCHRVVRADGSLGGFSGGLHWKKRLLKLERAECR
jgi:O-6-methylguanine DNA methyltransferase